MWLFQPEIAIPASVIWLISLGILLIMNGEWYEDLRRNNTFYDLTLPAITWIVFALTLLPALVVVICLIAIFVFGGGGRSNNY